MSKSVNKQTVLGRIGKELELRFMPSGGAVLNGTMATNRAWVDKKSGQKQEATDWHNFVLFDKAAEIVAKYAAKGDNLYIEGESRTRKWQDKSGNDRYTQEIHVKEFVLLGDKRAPANPGGSSGGFASNEAQGQAQPGNAAPVAAAAAGGFDEFDDDSAIPF